jgi:plasmid stabilization system protein ParE
MAYRVVWSPRALDDVDAIASYISRDSTAHASAVVTKIIRSTRMLRRFPLAGRVVPEFEDRYCVSTSSTAIALFIALTASSSPLLQ